MGKASLPKTPINDTLDANRDRKKQFGRERAAFSRVPFYSTSIGSGMNSNANSSVTSVEGLSTAGGTMMGPIAFYPISQTISNGTINVSSQNAYSSRVVINGQGSASDDLEVILGASHAGQIVFFEPVTMGQTITLQDFAKTATAWATGTSYIIGDVRLSGSRRYTCYVAHTSSSSTQPISGSDWSDKWHRNNIHIPGATEKVVQANEIILLQYDQSSNITWTVVSGGGSGGSSGAGLGDNNVWTGINTFNGAATSINSATINLGDSSGDAINIIGTVSSLGIPMGGNDINDVGQIEFSSTSHYIKSNSVGFEYRVPVGDTHEFFINGVSELLVTSTATTLGGDLDLATGDIDNVDRLNFKETSQRLDSTPTGIEYEVPSGENHEFLVNSTIIADFDGNGLTMAGSHDLNISSGDLTNGSGHNGNFTWSGTGNFSVYADDAYLYSATTWIGNYGGGDLCKIAAMVDFRDHTSSTNQTVPTQSDGYIEVKIGGLTKKLFYYS